MNLNFNKPLLQAKACLKRTIRRNITYDDNVNFKSGRHNDHLSNLVDSIAHGSQESDTYEDPHAYSCKKPHSNLVRALYNRQIVTLELMIYSNFHSHEILV